MYIGAHSSISPTILQGIKYIESISGNAIQIFAGNNQSSSLKKKQSLTNLEKQEINQYLKEYNLYLAIHAIYLLNFCSFPSESLRIKYAQDNLIYDLNLAEEIGASCVVLHIGYQKDLSREVAYQNMADNVFLVLKKTIKSAPNVKLALETPAGQGSQICQNLKDLGELKEKIVNIIKKSDLKNTDKNRCIHRLQFCVDTAHIFTSGYDIRNDKLLEQYFQEFDKILGLKNCCLVHLNDSKADLNSHRDIHAGLGTGFIFGNDNKNMILTLISLLKICKKNKIPIILETHKAGSPTNPYGELYAQEIGLLNKLSNYISERQTKSKILNELKNWTLISPSNKKNVKNRKNGKQEINGKQEKNGNNSNKSNKGEKTKKVNKKTSKQNNISFQNIPLINKFKIIQEYYNLIEKDRIRGIAYGRAVLALKNYPEEILTGDQVRGLKGIGEKIALKIDQYLKDGEMKIFKELKINDKLKKYKNDNKNNIESILGFGPAKGREFKKQGLHTVSDLRREVKSGNVVLNNQETIGLKYHDDLKKMIPRKETESVYKKILTILKSVQSNVKDNLINKYNLDLEIAGSYPSGKIESKDIDILIICRKYKTLKTMPKKIMDSLVLKMKNAGLLLDVLSKGKTKLLGIIKHSKICRHIDIRLLPEESEIAGRLYFTSGRDFNQMIRGRAKQMGFKLSEFGLFDLKTNTRIKDITGNEFKNEEKLMERIGLNYIPLEKRR